VDYFCAGGPSQRADETMWARFLGDSLLAGSVVGGARSHHFRDDGISDLRALVGKRIRGGAILERGATFRTSR